MMAISRLAGPLVTVLGASTDLVLRLLGMRRSEEAPVTEEEIRTMIGQGAEAGVFEPGERDLVDGVFSLADRQVGELMTPRTRLVALDADDPPEVNARKMAESPHAHFPLYRGSLDGLLGIVSIKDVWALAVGEAAATGHPVPVPGQLERLARPPLFVPESLRALRLLEVFRRGRSSAAPAGAAEAVFSQPVAVVIGEHGGTEGLVTLTDVLEAIVGDLPDGGPTGGAEVVRREDGSWLVDGQMAADELKALLGASAVPDPDRDDYHTVGGFVMTHLGRVPAAGDGFDWEGHHVEVMDMDGRRVDKVLVTPRSPEPADGTAPSDG